MPVKQITTKLGNTLPPEAPHNITFHIPGWDTAKALRRGDPELFAKLSFVYPRFGPWGNVRELTTALHPHLRLPATHTLTLFTHPDTIPTAARHAASPFRTNPAHRIPPAQLLFRVVDVPLTLPLADADANSKPDSKPDGEPDGDGATAADASDATHNGATVRLYALAYPTAQAAGAVGVWQNYGTGISSRLAAALLPAAKGGQVAVLGWEGDGVCWEGVPGLLETPQEEKGKEVGGVLPLGEGHAGLRRRIARLASGGGGVVAEEDVWLYPTGMAAIYRAHRALVEAREGGTVVGLGSVFPNTYHLFEESEGGMKHFGQCDADGRALEELEEWLEGEKVAGRKVAYIFTEFPSNPILVSLDLRRLRGIADKYGVPVVVDDTIGSFCNIDVSPVADVIITSITKSLSGYANVMGGALTLPPSSAHHALLQQTLTTTFRNEYFHLDATKLLSNSLDYLARSTILNRNALALATFLHTYTTTTTTTTTPPQGQGPQPGSSPSPSPTSAPALTAVLYPPFTNTHANYTAMMRPPTTGEEEAFTPGYGCLLALEFPTLLTARAFYDSLAVYHGPHLGAHQTLAFPFNDAIWGTDPAAAAYVRTFGARAEQVRVSVGLESEAELLDTFRAALEVAERVRRVEVEEMEGGGGLRN